MQEINIIAIILSSIIALGMSKWFEDRKEERQRRLHILSILIATRHAPISEDTVRALNMIDIIFSKDKEVRKLRKEYYDLLNNDGLNNEKGGKLRKDKCLELICEMANNLGFGKTITYLDIDRVYYPIGLGTVTNLNAAITTEFLRVLKASESFGAPIKDSLSTF